MYFHPYHLLDNVKTVFYPLLMTRLTLKIHRFITTVHIKVKRGRLSLSV